MGVFLGYTRVSRVGDRGDSLISPQLQQDAIAAWGAAHGHEIEMLPPELDASGARDDRPILLGAIDRIEAGERDGVAVWKFSRFTRSVRAGLRMLERIEDAGGQLRSATEQLDPSTVEGRMFRQIIFAFDEGEHAQKAEGFEAAKARAIERGVHICGRVPVGYRRRPDKRLEPDESGPVIAELFERKAAGASWGKLSRWLSAELGREVIPGSVRAIIRNPVYLGEARQGRLRNPGAHEALVDRATWQACQVAGPRPARSGGEPALLAGLVRCASCSRTMTSTLMRGRRVYRCRRRHTAGDCPGPASILAERLEAYVLGLVLPHYDGIRFALAPGTESVDEAVAERDRLASEFEGFLEAVRLAESGSDLVAAEVRRRERALREADREIARRRLAAPFEPLAGSIEDAWDQMAVADRRHVLGRSVGVVWVWPGRKDLRDRVRVVAAGEEPGDLSRRGLPAGELAAVVWADLDGEIREAGPQDLGEGAGGAGA